MRLHDADPDRLLGDKGYDSDEILDDLAKRGIEPVIRPKGNPLAFEVKAARRTRVKGYEALMRLHDADPDRLLGDKGYDSDEILDDLAKRGIEPVIRPDRTGR